MPIFTKKCLYLSPLEIFEIKTFDLPALDETLDLDFENHAWPLITWPVLSNKKIPHSTLLQSIRASQEHPANFDNSFFSAQRCPGPLSCPKWHWIHLSMEYSGSAYWIFFKSLVIVYLVYFTVDIFLLQCYIPSKLVFLGYGLAVIIIFSWSLKRFFGTFLGVSPSSEC